MVLTVQIWAPAVWLASQLLLSLTMPPFPSCERPPLPASLCPVLSSPGFHAALSLLFTVMSGPGACAVCCIPGSPGGPQTRCAGQSWRPGWAADPDGQGLLF